MKKATLTTVLMITMLFILVTVSHAQGNQSSWYSGLAYSHLAKQKITANEQNATAKKKEKISPNKVW